MRAIVKTAGAQLRDGPAPTEWSVIESVGHLLDSEIIAAARIRWIAAEDEPDIVGYDQDRWVDGLHLATMIRTSSSPCSTPCERPTCACGRPHRTRHAAGSASHRERGSESYDLTWRLIAGHDRFHLAQAERALATVRG